jgi:hypothetical protein
MGKLSKVQRNLRAAMKEGLRIQDRFQAEPLFSKTGKGFLKSEGVGSMQKIKMHSTKRDLRDPQKSSV